MIYEEDFTNFSWFTLYNHNKDPKPLKGNPSIPMNETPFAIKFAST